jgi:uncharacterized protein (DUF58 family)
VPVLTRRLAIVAAVASVATIVVPGTVVARLLIVNSVLLVVAIVDWLLAPRTVTVERDVPAITALGGTATITWHVRSKAARTVRVSVADALAPSLRADVRRFTVDVPPRGAGSVSTSFSPTRRGRFVLRDLVVRVDGPLGLAARQRTDAVTRVLRVYPQFRSRREAELRIDRARILEVGLRSVKGRGGGTDFDQLREYTVDDEFRRIDWSATARVGHPIVREFRAERNQNVVVLFDNGRVMAGRVGGVPRAEYAMDAALLLTTVATRLGDRCGLLAFDRTVRATVAPGHGPSQISHVTEALYELEPQLVESDYRGAFARTAAEFRRRALIVVLTDLVDQAVGDSLIPALPVLRAQHLLLIGTVIDPQIEEWAMGPVTNEASAYRQAAAIRTLAARRRAAAQLRAAGAVVVDTTPARLAADLGDAYLDFKATGRL